MTQKKPCVRCLLQEAGEEETALLIAEKIAAMPKHLLAEESVREKRLQVCTSCDDLVGGVCMRCGCYPEFRAAAKRGYCPMRYW